MVCRDFSSEIKKLWNVLDRLKLSTNQNKMKKSYKKNTKMISNKIK